MVVGCVATSQKGHSYLPCELSPSYPKKGNKYSYRLLRSALPSPGGLALLSSVLVGKNGGLLTAGTFGVCLAWKLLSRARTKCLAPVVGSFGTSPSERLLFIHTPSYSVSVPLGLLLQRGWLAPPNVNLQHAPPGGARIKDYGRDYMA